MGKEFSLYCRIVLSTERNKLVISTNILEQEPLVIEIKAARTCEAWQLGWNGA